MHRNGSHHHHSPAEPSAPPPSTQLPPPPPPPYAAEFSDDADQQAAAEAAESRRLRALVRAALEADEAASGRGGDPQVAARYLEAKRQLELAARSPCQGVRALAASLLEKVDFRLTCLTAEARNGPMAASRRASAVSTESSVGATELMSIPRGVRLYFVSADGQVCSGGSDNSLRIFAFDSALNGDAAAAADDLQIPQQPPAFITVGDDWSCPLVPGRTPVLAAANGAIVFPDPEAARAPSGASVGIGLPAWLDLDTRMMLLDVLNCLARLGIEQAEQPSPQPQLQPPPPAYPAVVAPAPAVPSAPPTSKTERVVSGIGWAAGRVARGVAKGGLVAEGLVTRARVAAQSRVPAAAPSEAAARDAELATAAAGVGMLRRGTEVGVQVSKALVGALSSGATYLATRVVYPHAVQPALNAAGVSTSGGSSAGRLGKAARVAGAAVSGASEVWLSLESAGSRLAENAADNGQALATHRWGQRAGIVTGDALRSGGNVLRIAWAADNLGVKAAAKMVAKETGKAALGRMAGGGGFVGNGK